MTFANFIPEVTSADLQIALQGAQVVIPTLNRDHEGEAKTGNAVKVVGAVTPTIVDYKAAGRKITAEDLADTEVTVLIDQEKAFAFKVDDIDATQAAGSLEPYTTAAGGGLAEDAEEYAVRMLLEGATSINVIGSAPVTIDTPAKAKKALSAIRTAFTKAKVPTADRFVAVNPAFADLVLEELSDASKSGSDEALRNGQIGRLYGMTILETPAFEEAVKPVAVGYHSKAATFIGQIDKTEALRDGGSFSDVVRGLNVYGAKVTRPAAVVSYVSGGTPAPVAP